MEERIMVKLAKMSNEGTTIYQMSENEYQELKANMLFNGSIIDESAVLHGGGYIGTVFGIELYHNKK